MVIIARPLVDEQIWNMEYENWSHGHSNDSVHATHILFRPARNATTLVLISWKLCLCDFWFEIQLLTLNKIIRRNRIPRQSKRNDIYVLHVWQYWEHWSLSSRMIPNHVLQLLQLLQCHLCITTLEDGFHFLLAVWDNLNWPHRMLFFFSYLLSNEYWICHCQFTHLSTNTSLIAKVASLPIFRPPYVSHLSCMHRLI